MLLVNTNIVLALRIWEQNLKKKMKAVSVKSSDQDTHRHPLQQQCLEVIIGQTFTDNARGFLQKSCTSNVLIWNNRLLGLSETAKYL